MPKYIIIALMGESGTGKDTLLKAVCEDCKQLAGLPVNRIIAATTRPPREGEVDGVDYHFMSNQRFTILLSDNKMPEANVFNGWCYGTPLFALKENCVNIGIFSPNSIHCLQEVLGKEAMIWICRVEASDKVRLIRQLQREENPNIEEIFRRYKADKNDFLDLTDFKYYSYKNENCSPHQYSKWLKKIFTSIRNNASRTK